MIDPGIDYSTYLGGTGSDVGNGIAVDAAGSAYVTGQTRARPNFPTTAGAFDTSHNGNGDAFVDEAERDRLGARSTRPTSAEAASDSGLGIAVDAAGNAYVTGYHRLHRTFPTTAGAVRHHATTQRPARQRVRDEARTPTGSALVYSTYLGRLQHERASTSAAGSRSTARAPPTSPATPTPANFPDHRRGLRHARQQRQHRRLRDEARIPTGSALVYSTYLGGTSVRLGHGDRGRRVRQRLRHRLWDLGRTIRPRRGRSTPRYNSGMGRLRDEAERRRHGALLLDLSWGEATYDEARGIAVDAGRQRLRHRPHDLRGLSRPRAGAFDTSYDNASAAPTPS